MGEETKSGEKLQKNVEIPGTEVRIPVTIINGTGDGKSVVITGGVHSGKYPGAVQLAQVIRPGDVNGAFVWIHPCNPTGFEAQISYFVPEDGKNLGHYFPGDPEGTLTDRICHVISQRKER